MLGFQLCWRVMLVWRKDSSQGVDTTREADRTGRIGEMVTRSDGRAAVVRAGIFGGNGLDVFWCLG